MLDANTFLVNDLVDYGLDALMFIRQVAARDPSAAQEICRFRNQRLLYVLERLDQAALRRLLGAVGCPFGPRTTELSAALDALEGGLRPKGLVNAPEFYSENEHFGRELERIQQLFWTLFRQEAHQNHHACATTFDIDDHQVIRRIATLKLNELRLLARFPIALRISQSSGFELALSLEGQGVTNPTRLAVAGMAAACFDEPAAEHAQGVVS